MNRLFMAGIALFAGVSADAATPGPTPYEGCFERVGAHYGLHPALLKAIARQESSMNPKAVNENSNGTSDRGLMQINSGWWPTLAKAGIEPDDLWDPCVNIAVGGWVLAEAVSRHGMSWRAVGAYHSPTEERQVSYAIKIQQRLIKELEAAGGALPGVQFRQRGRTAREELAAVEQRANASRPARDRGIWEAGRPDDSAAGVPSGVSETDGVAGPSGGSDG